MTRPRVPLVATRLRLDLALIRLHPGLSRRRARDVIEKGQVSLDGRTVREPGHAVPEAVDIRWDPHKKALPKARLSLPLLYSDETLLVVDKPAGLLSVPSAPGALGEDAALARVQDYVRHLTPRRSYVGVVHRLDRDTSGALAFALSPQARQAFRALFREHRIERRYSALVSGEPGADHGIVDRPLSDAYEGGRRHVAREDEPSRPALTRWSVVERFDGAALLDVALETGRQHQIRVHLAHIGLPVLGDAAYRPEASRRPPVQARRQMLHARLLTLVHPLTGVRVHVESPLPDDFRRVLAMLRKRRVSPGSRSARRGRRARR